MIRWIVGICAAAVLALAGAATGAAAMERAAPPGSPLAINGQLHVCGTSATSAARPFSFGA
jgi:hypothetical protein